MARRLALVLEKRGDLLRAETVLRDTMNTVSSKGGRSDPLYIQLVGPLDSVLVAQGKNDAATELWDGLPATDYCAPDPCPESLVKQMHPPRVEVKHSPSNPASNAARVVAELRPAYRACYNAGLARDRRMSGRISIVIEVDASGAVNLVKAQRVGYLDAAVARCVLEATRPAQFDPPAGGLAVIQVPVKFVQK